MYLELCALNSVQANLERQVLITEGRQSGPAAAAEAFGIDESANIG